VVSHSHTRPADPQPHLGAGPGRRGYRDDRRGRWRIHTAVTANPTWRVVRTYVGDGAAGTGIYRHRATGTRPSRPVQHDDVVADPGRLWCSGILRDSRFGRPQSRLVLSRGADDRWLVNVGILAESAVGDRTGSPVRRAQRASGGAADLSGTRR